jgi:outer membrane protein
MEMDGDTLIVLEKPPVPDYNDPEFNIDKEEVYEEALKINPDIRLALLKKQASAVNIKLAKGLYQPNISLLGGMITNYSSADRQLHGVKVTGVDTIGAIVGTSIPVGAPHYVDEYVNYPLLRQFNNNLGQYVGIGMQAQLFNHFSAHVSLAKARNADETAELNVRIAKDNLFKVIDQALLDLKAAIKTYAASSANVRSLVEAYATTVRRYDLNLTNTLDLETARAKLDKAQFDLIQAQYNLLFRRKVIDYYIGKPIIL